jgi:hypothetical protein
VHPTLLLLQLDYCQREREYHDERFRTYSHDEILREEIRVSEDRLRYRMVMRMRTNWTLLTSNFAGDRPFVHIFEQTRLRIHRIRISVALQ